MEAASLVRLSPFGERPETPFLNGPIWVVVVVATL